MNPVLSIIIPTKNRYLYLESCLKALSICYNCPEVEIIISDNSNPRRDIESINLFSNIKYFHYQNDLSQVENFENAMNHVSGEYVTMIGDDDGLSSLLLLVVNLMKKNRNEALVAPFVTYYWPDVVSKSLINNFSGKLFLKKYNYKFKDINVKNEIIKSLRLGGGSLCNLPRMYYGIIRRDVLEKVKDKSGFFFPGPSPDMANAFSSATVISSLLLFDAPLFIAGNSPKSAAGLGLSGKHVGDIEGNPMLPIDCHLRWSKLVPRFWSGPTIWAESLLKAAELMGEIKYIKAFNYPRLYANCLTFHPEYKVEIKDCIKQYTISNSSIYVQFKVKVEQISIVILRLKFLFYNLLRRFSGRGNLTYSNINNIQEASKLLNKLDKKIIASLNEYKA